jgi:hypothetical protein
MRLVEQIDQAKLAAEAVRDRPRRVSDAQDLARAVVVLAEAVRSLYTEQPS